ncbi:hypothetical protein [Cryobacterium roopkundense]|uniref:Uncharacterized protein n=1 Tax=Cryobacterium roopkundense TaxID=1001240 RepID=A0A7W9E4N1_9MICO|nr:hypothetical protein [Cryobacterium roopkundense]MBB5641110.1 hypothetical protein [Cryobacterium roopkundense]
MSTLRSTVKSSEKRESDLAGAEAAQSTRARGLDEREAAVKGAEDVVVASAFAGDGTFMVGTDVQPGQYRSEGGESCYWSRMNAAGDDTIDNYIGSGAICSIYGDKR